MKGKDGQRMTETDKPPNSMSGRESKLNIEQKNDIQNFSNLFYGNDIDGFAGQALIKFTPDHKYTFEVKP